MIREQLRDYHEKTRKNLRWNFVMHLLDGAFFGMGVTLAEPGTILPSFIAKLTSSDILIGLVPTISMVGAFLPQLLTAYHTEGVKLKKPLVALFGLGQRIPWLLIGLALLLFPRGSPGMLLAVFFVFYTVAMLSGGMVGPVWMRFVGSTMPQEHRGRLFALRDLGSTLFSLLIGGAVVAKLLRFSFPRNYAACFLVYVVFLFISFIAVVLVRETGYPVVNHQDSFKNYLKNARQILREDHNFRNYLLARALFAFSGMSAAYYMVFSMKKFNVAGPGIASLLVMFLLGKLSSILFGMIGDRKGNLLVFRLAAFAGIGAAFTAFTADSLAALYAVFFLQGVSASGQIFSGINLVLEFCRPEDQSTYFGLTGTLISPVAGLLPLIAGFLLRAGVVHYRALFLVAGLGMSAGLVLLFTRVKEPRNAVAMPVEKL